MLATLIMLGALAFEAGEIHHCQEPGGAVRFSDVPCEAGGEGVSVEELDDRSARAWLNELREPPPRRTGQPSPRVREAMGSGGVRRSVSPPQAPARTIAGLPERPGGESRLAACSLVFYECTRGSAAAMDRCITEAPRCDGRRAGACCHGAFVDRYRVLRNDGIERRAALRIALLGGD